MSPFADGCGGRDGLSLCGCALWLRFVVALSIFGESELALGAAKAALDFFEGLQGRRCQPRPHKEAQLQGLAWLLIGQTC